MLLPVLHVFLYQCGVQPDHSVEKLYRLLAIIDLSRGELVHILVVYLEFASLEELDRALRQAHGGQFRQFIVIVQGLLTLIYVFLQMAASVLYLLLVHEN